MVLLLNHRGMGKCCEPTCEHVQPHVFGQIAVLYVLMLAFVFVVVTLVICACRSLYQFALFIAGALAIFAAIVCGACLGWVDRALRAPHTCGRPN